MKEGCSQYLYIWLQQQHTGSIVNRSVVCEQILLTLIFVFAPFAQLLFMHRAHFGVLHNMWTIACVNSKLYTVAQLDIALGSTRARIFTNIFIHWEKVFACFFLFALSLSIVISMPHRRNSIGLTLACVCGFLPPIQT